LVQKKAPIFPEVHFPRGRKGIKTTARGPPGKKGLKFVETRLTGSGYTGGQNSTLHHIGCPDPGLGSFLNLPLYTWSEFENPVGFKGFSGMVLRATKNPWGLGCAPKFQKGKHFGLPRIPRNHGVDCGFYPEIHILPNRVGSEKG